MADRAIVTSYELDNDQNGDLTIIAKTSFVRDGAGGVFGGNISTVILAADNVNTIGDKVVASIQEFALSNGYDVSVNGQILLPVYQKA